MVLVPEAIKRTQVYFDRSCGVGKKPVTSKRKREEAVRPGSTLQLEGIMFESFLHGFFFNKLTK